MGRGSKTVQSLAQDYANKTQAMIPGQQAQQGQSRANLNAAAEPLGQYHDVGTYSPEEQGSMNYTGDETSKMGYSPEAAAMLESKTMGAAAEPFQGVEQSINRHVARTRNGAGAAGAIAKAAIDKSGATSKAALDVGTTVDARNQQVAQLAATQRTSVAGQTAQQRIASSQDAEHQASTERLAKVQTMAQQYGIDTNLLANILGLPISSLNTAGSAAAGRGGGTSLGPFGTWG